MSKEKVALIIGAEDYLGSAIARRFTKEGFHAVVTRRRGGLPVLSRKLKIPVGRPRAYTVTRVKRSRWLNRLKELKMKLGPLKSSCLTLEGMLCFKSWKQPLESIRRCRKCVPWQVS